MGLLRTSNADLARDKIKVWSLPAWLVELPDGSRLNVCPSAGVCAKHCYALKGTFRFKNVRAAHLRNLMMIVDDIEGWEQQMTAEVTRLKGGYVRIHDGGDFFSQEYLEAWLRIMRAAPHIVFYAYTKEIKMFKEIVEPDFPENFKFIYSYGGKYDHLITEDDRRADIFPDNESLENAGYVNQADSDLLAINGPKEVGIVVNNHAGAVKKMNGKSISEQQRSLRKNA